MKDDKTLYEDETTVLNADEAEARGFSVHELERTRLPHGIHDREGFLMLARIAGQMDEADLGTEEDPRERDETLWPEARLMLKALEAAVELASQPRRQPFEATVEAARAEKLRQQTRAEALHWLLHDERCFDFEGRFPVRSGVISVTLRGAVTILRKAGWLNLSFDNCVASMRKRFEHELEETCGYCGCRYNDVLTQIDKETH
jgi:hypothetical protein